jgi:hypothetical protein
MGVVGAVPTEWCGAGARWVQGLEPQGVKELSVPLVRGDLVGLGLCLWGRGLHSCLLLGCEHDWGGPGVG